MTTQTATNGPAIRELKDFELDAVNGGFYPWIQIALYVGACAALGTYLGSK
jgi:lactobin A/cerein 7B family class IIb bacteriocin